MSQLQSHLSSLQPHSVLHQRHLRLLVLTADLPPISRSGIGVSVALQCEALAKLGCSVRVLTPGNPPFLPLSGVTIHSLPADHFPADLADWDLIHLHSLSLAALALEASRRLQMPLIYTAHSLLAEEVPLAGQWIALQQKIFATAQHVFFLNRAERVRAVEQDISLMHRSSVLHHGLDAATGSIPFAQREPLIVVAGRFCHNKGTDVAVAALQSVMRSDARLRVLFAGGNGDASCSVLVEQLATEFSTRVSAPGWIDHCELLQRLRYASLALSPSRYEPFGLFPLEALRCGTPVIAACTEGSAETLLGNSGALLLPTYNPATWARVIEDTLRNRVLHDRLSALGPAWVRRHFNHISRAHTFLTRLASISLSQTGASKQEPQVFAHVA
jgi:D-inositol-3-phosphate glycosyltransferase